MYISVMLVRFVVHARVGRTSQHTLIDSMFDCLKPRNSDPSWLPICCGIMSMGTQALVLVEVVFCCAVMSHFVH